MEQKPQFRIPFTFREKTNLKHKLAQYMTHIGCGLRRLATSISLRRIRSATQSTMVGSVAFLENFKSALMRNNVQHFCSACLQSPRRPPGFRRSGLDFNRK